MPGDVVGRSVDDQAIEGSFGLGVTDEGPERDLVTSAAGDPPPAASADEHEFVAVVTAHAPGLTDHLDTVDRASEHCRTYLAGGHCPGTA